MNIDRWFSSGHRRKIRDPKSRPFHWRTGFVQHIEWLEERTLLSGVPLVDYDKISPAWFAAAQPAELETAPVTTDALLTLSTSSDDDGHRDDSRGDRWIVRLTRDAVSQINSVGEAARFLNGSGVDFEVIHGLGLPGQILVQTSGVDVGEVDAALSDNPYVAYFEPEAPITAQANTFVVDTLLDENDGNYGSGDQSLREALLRASLLAGPDVIQFHGNLAGGTITLNPSLGELVIDSDVDVQGPGADQLTIDAAFNDRVFLVSTGVTASMSGLTITGGQATQGGGIRNQGTLAIADSIISDNKATSFGGGISNVGTLAITGSTISGNVAENFGGGIDNDGTVLGAGAVTITNTTILGNSSEQGGGISVYQAGPATLTNVTVSHNVTDFEGGGIYNDNSTVQLANTIVAGNTAPEGKDRDTYGNFSSLGYNLIQYPGNSTGWTASDLLGVDPLLGPLQDNGGPTPTSALPVGSPAVDAGSNTLAAFLSYDQRGTNRFTDGDDDGSSVVDMGAYEWQWSYPGDTHFDELWGLHNTGQGGRTADADIDAPQAWEISTGSPAIVVAVIDTGVDYSHPDLAANMWVNPGETPGNGLDDDANGFIDDIYGYDFVNGIFTEDPDGDGQWQPGEKLWSSAAPIDDNGHGTHVAGIIGAVGNNGAGVIGVNWSTSIMAVKFLDENRLGYLSRAINSLNYVTMMREQYIATAGVKGANVRVINASWITQGTPGEGLRDAVEAARDADILIVAAAGNGSAFRRPVNIDDSPAYPASYDFEPGQFDNIIGVTATDGNDRLVSHYNFGPLAVDLAAPGTDIYSTWLSGSYEHLSGTSMAAPYVSGVAALVWSKAAFDLTAEEVRDAIFQGLDDLPDPADQGKVAKGGRLNAYGAMTADTIAPRADVTSAPAITHFTGGATYRFVVQYSDDQAVSRASLGNADVKVVSPGGAVLNAVFVPGSAGSSDGPVLEATYEIAVPGGSWDHGDNGTYQIKLQANQVFDTSSHAARPLDLDETELIGTFECNYGVFFVNRTYDAPDLTPLGDGRVDVDLETAGDQITLRAAVMEANAHIGDNTIVLGAGRHNVSIVGPYEDAGLTGDLDVTAAASLTIKGDPEGTEIWSTWNHRIFQVFDGATLHLHDVALMDGYTTGDGGGIHNAGTLTTRNVSIQIGSARGNGGGIYNAGNLYLENTLVSNNSALVDGGGIYSVGPLLDIRNSSTISDNWAGEYGGGIYSKSSQLTIKDWSSIVENTSNLGGGGIGLHGGVATIEDTTISNNVALSGIDADDNFNLHGSGGGIEAWTDMAIEMTLRRVTISSNQALVGGGINALGFVYTLDIVLDQCVISDNRAESHGGGIRNSGAVMSISDTTISGNSSTDFGGGVFNTSSLTVERSTFSNNTAGSTGGAIHNLWRVSLEESSVSNNTAGEKGGGIYSDSTASQAIMFVDIIASTLSGNSAQYGGGLYNGMDSKLTVANSTFSGNSSDGQGGAIFNLNNAATLTSSTITQNSSVKSVGGGIYSPGTVEVQNTIVAENRAEIGDPDCAGGGFRSLGNNLIGVGQTHVTFTLLESYDEGFGEPYATAADISADGSTVVGTTEALYVFLVGGFPLIYHPRNAFRQRLDGDMELIGINAESQASAVSENGDYVVGQYESDLGIQAFRWSGDVVTDLGDLPGGDFWSSARGVSADGMVVVGESKSGANKQAFRWESGNMQPLGYLAGGAYSSATDVSANGSVVVGESDSTGGRQAFRYTYPNMIPLGDLPGGAFFSSATAVSADGTVVVGRGSSNLGTEAFRHDGTVMQGLGVLYSGHNWSSAADVSADGNVVVGDSGTVFPLLGFMQAIIWDPQNQMRDLKQVLVDNFDVIDETGAAVSLPLMSSASGISDNGTVIVGYGFDASGTSVGWIVSDFPRIDGFAHGVNGDQVGTTSNPLDPMLGPLQDNRGPTLTHVPKAGSPAIDAGNTAAAASTDQRGVARPQDGDRDGSQIADIGAVERYYGQIAGVKFYDLNNNGGRDPGEPGLAGWQIFADLNSNGVLDEGEPNASTDANGNYTLTLVPPGNHRIVEVLKPGWEQSYPSTADPGPGFPGQEFQVNTETASTQGDPSIAMDDLGNFVAVWQSYAQDGSGYGIFAQMYHADGTPKGSEFQVNTYTTGVQASPAVALDASSGAFVIAWSSSGQDGSSSGIYAQRYFSDATPNGTEFRVNTYTAGYQSTPSVAMDDVGRFVVAWNSDAQDGSGYGVYAQRYNADGTPYGTEFRVNTYTAGDQTSASVAMDDAGRFVIAWTSLSQDGSGYGVYAQRYEADGTTAGTEFQVNTVTASSQWRPAAAVDDVGNFVIAWESSTQDGSGYGIYARRYFADGAPADGTEFRVNTWTAGSQDYASVAMDASGRFVITWRSYNQDGSGYGVYGQVFDSDGSPSGTEFLVNTHTDGYQYYPAVAMDASGRFAVAWRSDGQDGSDGGVFAKQFSGFQLQNIHAGPEFQVNTVTASAQSNASVAVDAVGNFVVAWQSSGQDGSNYGVYAQRYHPDGTPNGSEFRVNSHTTNSQYNPSVAMNASTGAFLVAWASYLQDASSYGIYAQRYLPDGTPDGTEFRVNTYTTGNQSLPEVAIDLSGRFIIAWQSDGQDGSGAGVYAQRYDAGGKPSGTEFRVNSYTTGSQSAPTVAMDDSGRFVVAWQSGGQDGSGDGIYARRYDAGGKPSGTEFQVNTYTAGDQTAASLAMDAAGNFVIAWESLNQDGSDDGIYAQRYDANGTRDGSEFRVNTWTSSYQSLASVAMDARGRFLVTWSSYLQDDSGYGVYAQAFNSDGTPSGTEFPVNTYTDSSQYYSTVAMDASGGFTIAWRSDAQDGSGAGVFAKQFIGFREDHIHQRVVGVVETVRNVDFGNQAVAGVLRGQVFDDLDGNRVRNSDAESSLSGWTVLLDTGGDGQYDETTQTDSQGNYLFVVPPGNHIVNQNTADWEQTSPTQEVVLNAAFNGGADGFGYSGQWHLSTQRGVSTPAQSFYFGAEEPLGGGRYPSNVAGSLGTLSAIVDLTDQTGTIRLEFKHFLRIQEFDIARVSVTEVAGGVSEVVADNQEIGGLAATTGDFQTVTLDLSKYAGKEIRIEFTVQPGVGVPRTDALSAEVTAGQTYYVRVDGLDGSTHPMYDLAITSPGVPVDRIDFLGANDDPATATDFGALTDRTEDRLTIEAGDQDWYKFLAPATRVIHAHLLFQHALGDLDFFLYDSALNPIASSISTTDNEAISVSNLEAGKEYYLQVKGYAASAANPSYDLVLFTQDIEADEYETLAPYYNDDIDHATMLGAGSVTDHTEKGLTIHQDDVDFYEFVAAETSTFGIHLLFRHGLGDLSLFLYDEDGRKLSDSRSGDDNESVYADLTAGKTYYVSVQGHTQYSYDLVIDGGEIRRDRFDPPLDPPGSENNDFGSATDLGRLGYRSETNLTIHAADNEDYFSFVAEADGTVHIDLRFDQTRGDIDLFLYDSGHNLLASSEGWYIDDVKVESLGRYDVQAVIGEEITGLDFGVRQIALGTGDQYTGSISGWVFEDANENQHWDTGEGVVADVKVWLFVDENGDGTNELETFTVTNPSGYYSFTGLAPKTLEKPYQLRLEGWQYEQTYPLENNFEEKYTVTPGDETDLVPPDPQSVTLGYFNDDALLDLAMVDHQKGNLFIWLNSGNAADPFSEEPQSLSLSDAGLVSVISADFDGQNGDDLAVVNFNTSKVWVLLNTGGPVPFSLQETHKQVISVGVEPESAAVGYFNNDAHLDLVVANDFSGNLSVLLNNGDGTFTSEFSGPVGVGTFAVASGDFYGHDGHPDLVVANFGDGPYDWSVGSVVIMQNNGSGVFAPAWSQVVGEGSRHEAPCSVATGDFNGDSLTDFAVANHVSLTVSVFWNVGSPDQPDFAEEVVDIGSGPTSVIALDMDRDGDLDLVVTTGLLGADPSAVKVLRNVEGQMWLEESPGGILGSAAWPQSYAFSATDASGLHDSTDGGGPPLAVVHFSQVFLLKNSIQGGSHKKALAANEPLTSVNLGMKSPPGIEVNPTSGLTTTESGGTGTFTVQLKSRPTANVTIGVSSNDPTEGVVAPASLIFTRNNWSDPQTVTVTGVNDFVDDGDAGYAIVVAAATSTDPRYNGLDAADVSVTNLDDDPPPAEIVDRRLFYNNSLFDNRREGADSEDDIAIAPDKQALLPGQTATFANYTSYDKGINGLMIDVRNLLGTPTADDFVFRVGNDDQPYGTDPTSTDDDWPLAPAPIEVATRAVEGQDNLQRVTLIWDASAIRNQWLQVTMVANQVTGLSGPDVFYVGNAVGESGDSATNTYVNATDEIAARNDPHGRFNPAAVVNHHDYNRDTYVNATDELIARNNPSGRFNSLRLITAPVGPGGGEGEAAAAEGEASRGAWFALSGNLQSGAQTPQREHVRNWRPLTRSPSHSLTLSLPHPFTPSPYQDLDDLAHRLRQTREYQLEQQRDTIDQALQELLDEWELWWSSDFL